MAELMRRIGMLVPSSNTAVERIAHAVCRPLSEKVSIHFTRFRVTTISLEEESLAQFQLESMLAAARLLADAPLDAVVWNGTAGAWLGVEADEALCRAIERDTGIPASTSVLAQIDAMAGRGIRRYALATPYRPEVNECIITTFHREGFTCPRHAALGISANRAIDAAPLPRIREHVLAAAVPGVDAVLILCTNFPAAYLVDELESVLGIPITDSTLAGIWKGLRMAGITTPIEGWGWLLRHEAGSLRPRSKIRAGATVRRALSAETTGRKEEAMDHTRFLDLALEEAEIARRDGCVPAGSVIVARDGRIMSRGRNRVRTGGDQTAHSEVDAIRNAGAELEPRGTDGGQGYILYTSAEPCLMCLGAILVSHIDTIVWAASSVTGSAYDAVLSTGYGLAPL
jgi:maleate isomerase